MNGIKIFTIGFTKKTAEEFFSRLIRAGVKRVIDIRLNNVSQLAGFAKRDDLCYFLWTIGKMDYVHRPDLAPTQQILDNFKKNKGSWEIYEKDFLALLASRKVETEIKPELLHEACLLCSEEKPTQCHRRLVVEYFQSKWENVRIIHL
ncbi:MAG TPA: DUF488 domain-containing protein [Smithella sp.]|jgi:uncharacterized protein (DUF488 family)|nr:DUF488 domain-containing protein [Alphaproteobacteria bacterium]HPC08167.1 DUF488 domain-containing protein [Smithella sp.]HQP41630.1 DUF488 domain-containing protein [Smithella sp.]